MGELTALCSPLDGFKGAGLWQGRRGREDEGRGEKGKGEEGRDGGRGGEGSLNRATDWLRPALHQLQNSVA